MKNVNLKTCYYPISLFKETNEIVRFAVATESKESAIEMAKFYEWVFNNHIFTGVVLECDNYEDACEKSVNWSM
jgi:hypothetical protein